MTTKRYLDQARAMLHARAGGRDGESRPYVHTVIQPYPIVSLAGLFLLSALTLAASAQPITFDDASQRAGLTTDAAGHGIAVHDYDGDGWDDVFITVPRGASVLFRNNGDATFTNATAEAGLAERGAYNVALWGDVDNDGHADLFLGRTATGQNKLYRNRGDGTFEDVTVTAGLDLDASIATAAFGDVDGDGALDLFMAVNRASDVLFRNTNGVGPALFEDISTRAGIAGSPPSVPMQATWVDYDHDDDLDLFCVHDSRTQSRLYKNNGYLPLFDVAAASRIDTYPAETVCCNMGIAWGDFDGDGWQDAYVTRIGHGGLFHNNGDGTFDDIAAERGADRNGMSWGVVFADFDNDGDPDLFIVTTSGYDGTPTLLYRNDDGFFTEIGAQAHAAFRLEAQGLATGDFNNDGRPDLIMPDHDGHNKLLLNATEGAGHWVEVRLRAQHGNRMAIGARVEVVAGGKTMVRTLSGGDSYASQSSATMHVGLGAAARIDTLRIHWGGGRMQAETDLAVDHVYVFTEGVVATGRDAGEALPQSFLLQPVYPNPLHAVATIRYTLADAGPTRLDVFDMLGRRVVVLVDAFLPAGAHDAVFDARHLPGGLYLYRLQAGSRIEMKTMVLVR